MKKITSFAPIFLLSIFLSCSDSSKTESEKQTDTQTVEQTDVYLKKGKEIALTTFGTLSAELGKALKDGGVPKAIEVCNISAFPLVDSLSKVHNATIRRTSFKIRNPKNAPSSDELKVLSVYAKKHKAGATLQPKVETVNGMISFYAPIMTQPLCLNCHGKVGETMKEEDYKTIKSFYPEDNAIGYNSEELRGIWSIQFEK